MKMGPCIVRVLQRNTNIMNVCVCIDRDFKPLAHEFVEVGKSKRGWQGRERTGAGNPGKSEYC